ncbi:amidohydrolase [Fulvivirgaceae bacterium PWU4]|uniref:Amidohydrolase n=1 Tax=Chryseosolibacter histidini TaxID=2782349 RepID=A0AAP2DRL9_9BACT|nr:amidohydrolase [Chryseosolibacter histidini]MBT1701281.1 amidohydrolase [Chryseosolibacter histidini]
MRNFLYTVLCLTLAFSTTLAQVNPKLQAKTDQMAKEIEAKVIEWRRYFHEHPELSNREFKTAEKVAAHLKSLGIEVQTGIAKTGVVGLLKGGKPGPVIALRADMDALPVTERNSLAFASKEKTTFNGQETGVMHACGHDAHVAILMGVAEILAKNRNDLKGTIKFIFQPAEEGPPAGEEGGAGLMVKEGVLDNPKVDVIFGLHVRSITPVGRIEYRPLGFMAASDWFTIKVYGKQAHGSAPWKGIDPIVVSAQIINGLQTIISRQTELTKEAAVITVGRMNAGIRENIIPEYAEMAGTIRTFDPEMQQIIHEKIKLTAIKIAESAGARAEVTIDSKTPVTYNDQALTERMVSALQRAAGEKNVVRINPDTGAEDFAYYQKKVPGLFFFVGACPPNTDPAKAPSHHTPDFMMDEASMLTGVKAMLNVTLDYMYAPKLTKE